MRDLDLFADLCDALAYTVPVECAPLEALRYSSSDAEEVARIDRALARAKRARSKPKRKSATEIPDAAVRKAFAKHGVDDDEDLLGA